MSDSSLVSETRAWHEYRALRRDPVFRGEGVPVGDGRPVLVLPGLFGNDTYLRPLRHWLDRVGYRPLASSLMLNVGCPERLRARVSKLIERETSNAGAPLTIIGHSRGGMLGKALASALGNRCECLVALGSPLGAVMRGGQEWVASQASAIRDGNAVQPGVAAEAVVWAGRGAMRLFSPDCSFPECDCRYLADLLAPLPESTRTYALYSLDDPVVSPEAGPLPGAVNIEVAGSHSGLVVNADVYRHLGQVLSGQI